MKYTIIFVLALFALASAEEWKRKEFEEVKAIRAECLKEAPLSEDTLKKVMHLEYPNEESVRKYILCTATKVGLFCAKEGLHPDRVAQQFQIGSDEEEIIKLINACADKNEQNSPVEEWVYRGHECLMTGKLGERVKSYIHEQYKKLQAEKKE
uniref:Odorant binding protein 14 n=1 Tax=Liriomyza sativae TaxID=127406 RepID=A0A0X9LEB1_LIRSA|nr:odorant binding protein 14 [Liriomyza sativae]